MRVYRAAEPAAPFPQGPVWHQQIPGAASFCTEGAGGEGGDLPPLPKALLVPLPPAALAGLTRTLSNLQELSRSIFLSLLLPRWRFRHVGAVSSLFPGVCSIQPLVLPLSFRGVSLYELFPDIILRHWLYLESSLIGQGFLIFHLVG